MHTAHAGGAARVRALASESGLLGGPVVAFAQTTVLIGAAGRRVDATVGTS